MQNKFFTDLKFKPVIIENILLRHGIFILSNIIFDVWLLNLIKTKVLEKYETMRFTYIYYSIKLEVIACDLIFVL